MTPTKENTGGIFVGKSETAQTILQLLDAAYQASQTAILWGPPGIGKTALLRALAKKHDLPIFILIPSTMDPTDVDGLPALKEVVLPNGETVQTTANTLPWWAQELITRGEGILFFDEASTAVPAVQAALLSVLQGRRVGRHTLPDKVWMIAAANEASDAADGWELAPPLANRFMHIEYPLVLDDFFDGFSAAWNAPNTSEKEYQERALLTAFLKQKSDMVHKMPKNAAEAGKAWPSPRSWDNLVQVLSYLPESAEAARQEAVLGFVGEAAMMSLNEFMTTVRLPKYETVLADPKAIDWKGLNTNAVWAILSMVVNRMAAERTSETFRVFGAVGEDRSKFDVGVALVPGMIDKWREVGGQLQPGDIDSLLMYTDALKDAGLMS